MEESKVNSYHLQLKLLVSISSLISDNVFHAFCIGPEIGSVVGLSRNGSINLQWYLTSTGGIPYADISVDVTCGSLSNTVEERITYTCSRNCINPDLTGNDLVGPVHAGFRYRCVVTISNGVGLGSMSTSAINGMTGKMWVH